VRRGGKQFGRRAGEDSGSAISSPPDGYTLLYATTANTINASLYDKLSFNLVRDSTPIAGSIRQSNVMVVNPSLVARSVPDFIAYAKANPGKINMASSGNGTTPHLSGGVV